MNAYFKTNKWADHVVAAEHAMPESLAQLRQAGSMGSKPLAVFLGGASDEADEVGIALQGKLAELSSNSQIVHIAGANHSTLVHDQRYAREVAKTILEMVNLFH